MYEVEDGARAFVEEIPIEVAGAEQRDPMGESVFDLPARGDRPLYPLYTLAELQPCDDAPVALDGVIAKICGETDADKRRKDLACPQAKLTEQRHGASESQEIYLGQPKSPRVIRRSSRGDSTTGPYRRAAGIARRPPQLLLDADELIVLREPVRA